MGISYGIEGNEGAGKSLLFGLTKLLIQKTTGFPVMGIREPGGTDLGEEMRTILRSQKFKGLHSVTNTLLYSASRSELFFHKETPFLADNPHGILLKDRTWLSTFALQSVDGASLEYIEAVQKPFMSIPERFVIIDIPVEETMARLLAEYRRENNSREPDWRDGQNYEALSAIRQNYLRFASENRQRCIVLDCFEDPCNNAAIIELDAITILSKRESEAVSIDENRMLQEYADEARKITEAEEIHVYTPVDRYVKVFDIQKRRAETEIARKELGFADESLLRRQMHNEWQQLGIECTKSNHERQ